MPLTEAQVRQYFDEGYLLLEKLIDPEALKKYDERFVEYARGDREPVERMKVMRDIMVVRGAVEPASPVHAINKMIGFEEDEVLFGYVEEPKLLDAVRSLIGDDIYSITTNVFNKPPDIDGRHPMHQDLRYFRIRPADKIVGAWTALLPATRETGCLSILPGTHRGPLHEHGDPDWEYVNFAFFGIEGVDRDMRVHIEMEPGDTLLFHPVLIHGSGRNRSAGFRRAISAHFASAECTAPETDAGAWNETPQVRHLD